MIGKIGAANVMVAYKRRMAFGYAGRSKNAHAMNDMSAAPRCRTHCDSQPSSLFYDPSQQNPQIPFPHFPIVRVLYSPPPTLQGKGSPSVCSFPFPPASLFLGFLLFHGSESQSPRPVIRPVPDTDRHPSKSRSSEVDPWVGKTMYPRIDRDIMPGSDPHIAFQRF